MSTYNEERIEALEARLEESELKAAQWESRAEALEQVINDTIRAMRDDLAETIKREKVT